jgi:hypothetical protein
MLADSIPWNRFLGSLKIYNTGSRAVGMERRDTAARSRINERRFLGITLRVLRLEISV